MFLTRFWIEFNPTEVKNSSLSLGCGITAWTYQDAINILKNTAFKNQEIPNIIKVKENVDVSTLEANHVLPNILNVSHLRGIWYPQF